MCVGITEENGRELSLDIIVLESLVDMSVVFLGDVSVVFLVFLIH